MKFWLFIFISLFATVFIKNANSAGDGGQGPKLNKTFDEIFGKGWDDESNDSKELNCRHVKEEDQEVQAPITNDQKNNDEILKQKFDEIYAKNWSEDDNEFIEEDEADSTDQNDCIDGQKCQKVQENGTKLIKRRKNDYSDQQKREILDNYFLLIEKYKQKENIPQKSGIKFMKKISKSVGVGHKTIKKWKKEFGLSHKLHSIQEKMEKLKHYCEIKKSNPKISDFEIAESLNIGGNTLKQWKRELKNAVKDENDYSLQEDFDQITQNKFHSDQQKREILKQFDEIKSKCKKAKLKNFSKNKLDDKIAKKLGVSRGTITEWKRKLGLSVSNKISDGTKIGILKEYAKIKGKNPKMSERDIADLLKISISSLNRWKIKFCEEYKHL